MSLWPWDRWWRARRTTIAWLALVALLSMALLVAIDVVFVHTTRGQLVDDASLRGTRIGRSHIINPVSVILDVISGTALGGLSAGACRVAAGDSTVDGAPGWRGRCGALAASRSCSLAACRSTAAETPPSELSNSPGGRLATCARPAAGSAALTSGGTRAGRSSIGEPGSAAPTPPSPASGGGEVASVSARSGVCS